LAILAGALGGGGNADDAGADARFRNPNGIAGDGAGNLYVADTLNQVIRKIVISTGLVTTIAGRANDQGTSNGVGTDARFNFPWDLTCVNGSLFIVDLGSHDIRKLDLASGAVTTFAGTAARSGDADGPGAQAQFNSPEGIAAADGSLYVADSGNAVIRRIDIATGAVSTLAGSPGVRGSVDGTGNAARFSVPTSVAADGLGHLFVSDDGSSTIREIRIATAAVTTLAGSPGNVGSADGMGSAARFHGPGGLASDGVDSLFVADTDNQTIRRISVASGEVTTIAGIVSADCFEASDARHLCFPRGLALEAGTLYAADSFDTIRTVTLDGAIGTLAGRGASFGSADGLGAARFGSPALMDGDGDATLFIADTLNHTIRRAEAPDGAVATVAGTPGVPGSSDGIGAAARFERPSGVAFDRGYLYVADTDNDTIRKIALTTGQVTTVAGMAHQEGLIDGAGAAARFNLPVGVAADRAGHLYAADLTAIRRIDLATRTVSTLAGSASPGSSDGVGAAASFNEPNGIALDGAGNLYVADSRNHTIRRIAIASGEVLTIAGSAGVRGSADGAGADARFDFPTGVLVGSGSLFVADSGNSTIRKIDLATAVVSTLAGQPGISGVKLGPLPARLNQPFGVALLGQQLFISDANENAILLIR